MVITTKEYFDGDLCVLSVIAHDKFLHINTLTAPDSGYIENISCIRVRVMSCYFEIH